MPVLAPGSDTSSARMGIMFCLCQARTVGRIVQTFCIFSAFGCLLVWLSATFSSLPERAALKSPPVLVEWSVSPFNSVSTCILGLSCSSDWIISINLFQSLWILFSTNSDLMLSLSSKIISITVLFHSRPLTLFIICIYFSILYLLRHCSHIFP